jgi:hypothetical protein
MITWECDNTLQVIHPIAIGINAVLMRLCERLARFHFGFTRPRPLFWPSLVFRLGAVEHIPGDLLPWN